jgi:mono/diheme cytochrome c family protein
MKSSIRTKLVLLLPLIAMPAVVVAAHVSEVWTEHCARCHGADGSGNTKVGKKMKVKDYTSAAVQAKMTDEEILKAIEGGVFDEKKKEKMPAYKEKLSEKEMKDLVAEVRAFKK